MDVLHDGSVMCRQCDKLVESVDSNREDEPCPEGECDYGEQGEWPADWGKDSEIICQSCGWSLTAVRQHYAAQDTEV
jgi:hypothetical protein